MKLKKALMLFHFIDKDTILEDSNYSKRDTKIIRIIYCEDYKEEWIEFGMLETIPNYGYEDDKEKLLETFIKEDILNMEVIRINQNEEFRIIEFYISNEEE